MRITIIGASHLGLTIAKLLANESYDVILVDENEAILESIRDELDILTIHADGTSPSLMRDPDIRKSDFLVAATASDESNIISSILARQNGIPHTIARIREMKYLSEPASYLHENFDIDLILSPELITAREIFQLLRTPHALNIEDFAGGRVRLLETKLSTTSPLIHIPLHALSLPPSLLIAMVQRDHDILIPHGDDCLLPMDNVYFLGTPASLSEMESRANLRVQRKAKKVVIIGAGRIGQALAPMLEAQGLSVKVIDKDRKRCEAMAQKLRKGLVLAGDGTDMDLLTAEGIGEADTVICLTKDERLNMMMALLAKHLGARQTIVRVIRSEYALLMQQVGIDIALSTHILAAGEVLSYIRKGSVVSISFSRAPASRPPRSSCRQALPPAAAHSWKRVSPRNASSAHSSAAKRSSSLMDAPSSPRLTARSSSSKPITPIRCCGTLETVTRRHQTPVSSFRAKREIFVIRGEGLTLSPHVPRTSPLSSSVFHTAPALSAPSGHLPLEGKAVFILRGT